MKKEDDLQGEKNKVKQEAEAGGEATRDEENENDEDLDPGDSGSDEREPSTEVSERRRRNREHAKRSRSRRRDKLGGLEEMVLGLRRENVRLRHIVKKGIPDRAEQIIRTCSSGNTDADLIAKRDVVQGMRPGTTLAFSSSTSTRGGSRLHSGGGSRSKARRRVPSALKLMSPCYQIVKALSESQANFVLTNPNLPGSPIIFASPGFLALTGYEAKHVVDRNCRMLQGPGTDLNTVSIIRNNLAQGRDTSVCILNYKADGTPFW